MSLQTTRRALLLTTRDPYPALVMALDPVIWLGLREVTGSLARNLVYTAGPGPELLANSDFSAWSGDDPSGWTVSGETGPTLEVTERGSGQSHGDSPAGTGSANLYDGIPAGGNPRLSQAGVLGLGDSHRWTLHISQLSGGSGLLSLRNLSEFAVVSSEGTAQYERIADATGIELRAKNASGNDITIDSVSIVKTGELDALIGGTTSILTITQQAAINSLPELTLWMQVKANDAGENDAGALAIKADDFELYFNSTARDLYAKVHYASGDAETITSTTVPAGEFVAVEMCIDDTSKTISIYLNGVEASYASQTAGMGSRSASTGHLIVGNNATVSQTFNGLIDELLLLDRLLTAGERSQLEAAA